MYISTIHSLESLEKLKEAGIDAVIIGVPYYSIRHCIEVDKTNLKVWKDKCKELNIKLYVNFLRMCSEKEIEKAKEWMQIFKDINIDGIYYADEGILYIAQEMNIQNKLIYQPETLVTSSMDVNFYLEQGIQAVSLAHEMSLDEIMMIAQAADHLEVLVNGYFSIMYSRRPLISNYLDAINSSAIKENKRYDLIEKTRDERMPIYEDHAGTHIFSANPISSFEQMDSLKEAGIKRFRIDSIFFDDVYTIQVLNAYKTKTNLNIGCDRWYHETTIKKKEGQ